jgi:phosphate:Na+ symporter
LALDVTGKAMVDAAFKLLGGIGLFLLAINLLTDGLKTFAGEALSRALVRFTGTPLKAFTSGAIVTVLAQSSTATTVTLIGFVSAGLISFPQAVGVVMGAGLGTTATGWVISVFGLKISLGFYALPLVGIGAFLKLGGRGRWRGMGTALAGLGLMFVAIDILQGGMQGISSRFDLHALPTAGLGAHVIVMLVGIVMTLILQSSTAAVATTLTALHAGAISFDQAAVLVIGASIGTTATALIAAAGASVPARRTALAYVVFSLTNGILAVLGLPAFLWVLEAAQRHLGLAGGPTSLAAFHSLFTATGVALFLPFAHRYARLIERLLPDRGLALTRHLDDSVLEVPPVALEATHRALTEIAFATLGGVRGLLGAQEANGQQKVRASVRLALQQTQHFFARIPASTESRSLLQPRLELMYAIEHLHRLQPRLRAPRGLSGMLSDPRMQPALVEGRQALRLAELGLRGEAPINWLESVQQSAAVLSGLRQDMRTSLMEQTAGGERDSLEALKYTDFIRWLERSAHHAWRVAHYLSRTMGPTESEPKSDNGPDADTLDDD